MACDSRFATYVGKRTIAVVVEEPTGARFEYSWNAVVMYSGAIGATAERRIELRKLAYKEIEPSVIVVVEPDCAGTPSRRGHTGGFCHIGEGAIAVVAIEN